jgi:hypothetical protein
VTEAFEEAKDPCDQRNSSKKIRYRPPNPDKKSLVDPQPPKTLRARKKKLNALAAQKAAA